MHKNPWQMDPPSIGHRCLEYHFTKLGRSIYIQPCIYTHGRLTPSQRSIDAFNTTTPNLEHLMAEQCTYTSGRCTPLSQSSIDALNTATPNLADLYIYKCSDSDIPPFSDEVNN